MKSPKPAQRIDVGPGVLIWQGQANGIIVQYITESEEQLYVYPFSTRSGTGVRLVTGEGVVRNEAFRAWF